MYSQISASPTRQKTKIRDELLTFVDPREIAACCTTLWRCMQTEGAFSECYPHPLRILHTAESPLAAAKEYGIFKRYLDEQNEAAIAGVKQRLTHNILTDEATEKTSETQTLSSPHSINQTNPETKTSDQEITEHLENIDPGTNGLIAAASLYGYSVHCHHWHCFTTRIQCSRWL